MQTRVKIMGVLFALSSVALLAKLFFWQVLKADELSDQARSQHSSGETLLAKRGSILASDKTWLAKSEDVWLLYAQPQRVTDDKRTVANKLAPFLVDEANENDDEKDLLRSEASRIEGLLAADLAWVPIKHKVSNSIKKNIEAIGILGLGFDEEEERIYPEASQAAHVLGFVGKDDNGTDRGYFGLEGYYDLSLSGKSGFVRGESDATGNTLLFGNTKEISAVSGVDLVTNIDKTIQRVVEEKLKDGLEKYGASEGSVVVMNPATGAILAMAALPSYDPAKYYEFGNEFFKNPIISDSFEPGSVFKPVVMVSALDAGVVEPDTKCDICSGAVKIDKYSIETWNKEYRAGSTMTDVIVHSDNVGMVFVSQKLGEEGMYDYLKKFGLGEATGIDLQGEASPSLRDENSWSYVDNAVASFGQGIAVTPIQMLKAIAVIANEGKEVSPRVVDKILSGGFEQEVGSSGSKRIISKKAASEVTAMMVKAVKEGESKWVQARGFEVAGKTGTAQIPVSGHYDEDKTIASFVGFAPAANPKFIMLVTLREPQTSPWASETAAPVWFSVAKELFLYFGIQPKS